MLSEVVEGREASGKAKILYHEDTEDAEKNL
jgi:hypothetical protein